MPMLVGSPYRAVVMCPPHLVETWQAELRQVFHPGTIEVHVLAEWRELLSYPQGGNRRNRLGSSWAKQLPRMAPTGGRQP